MSKQTIREGALPDGGGAASADKPAERIGWIDMAKGIAILLVVLGHTVGFDTTLGNITRGVIYSFHMPLFFILSCVTFRFSTDNDQFVRKTEKAFRHLVIPYFALCVLRIVLDVIKNFSSIEWKSYAATKIITIVYGSGISADVMGASVPEVGIPWFLMALFLGRTFFDYLRLKLENRRLMVAVIVCALAGVTFGMVQWLPLSFDVVLATMPFFYFGNFLKNVDMKKSALRNGCVLFCVWAISLLLCYVTAYDYLGLAGRKYILFPLCHVAAMAATMCIGYFCAKTEKWKVMKPLTYLGKNSMYFLWIHVMDYTLENIWRRTDNHFIVAFFRILTDIVLTVILIRVMSALKKIRNK